MSRISFNILIFWYLKYSITIMQNYVSGVEVAKDKVKCTQTIWKKQFLLSMSECHSVHFSVKLFN